MGDLISAPHYSAEMAVSEQIGGQARALRLRRFRERSSSGRASHRQRSEQVRERNTRRSRAALILRASFFNDAAGIRLFDSRIYVRRPVAGARITGTALAAKLFAPGPVR